MVIISGLREKLSSYTGSLRIKFFLTYFSIVAVVLIILNTCPAAVTKNFIYNAKYNSLGYECALISSSIEALDVINEENIGLVMEVLEMDGLDSIIITDSEMNIMYQKLSEEASLEGQYRQCLEDALQSNDVFYSKHENGAFISMFAAPIFASGQVWGAICIMNYDAEQGGVLTALKNNIIRISAVLMILSIIVCIFFTQKLTSRLRSVFVAIRNVREGEYGYRIDVSGTDEVSQLAQAFNSMTDRLQKTEEARKQFVSDASHELKTPLASIQLLSDSITQNDIKDQAIIQEFVSDIGDEARRLARTTEKLLKLTNLDNQTEQPAGPEDISDIVRRAVKILRPLGKQRNIEIITELEDGCTVFINRDDMYQIVINLVENAIKYNTEHGKVYVKTFVRDNMAYISVSDTGPGIEEEKLGKIFDRFYRVDKARSRADGGSGLGLSIVKSSAEQYGGRVTAENRPEGGMCFTVEFKKYGENGRAGSEDKGEIEGN